MQVITKAMTNRSKQMIKQHKNKNKSKKVIVGSKQNSFEKITQWRFYQLIIKTKIWILIIKWIVVIVVRLGCRKMIIESLESLRKLKMGSKTEIGKLKEIMVVCWPRFWNLRMLIKLGDYVCILTLFYAILRILWYPRHIEILLNLNKLMNITISNIFQINASTP